MKVGKESQKNLFPDEHNFLCSFLPSHLKKHHIGARWKLGQIRRVFVLDGGNLMQNSAIKVKYAHGTWAFG